MSVVQYKEKERSKEYHHVSSAVCHDKNGKLGRAARGEGSTRMVEKADGSQKQNAEKEGAGSAQEK